MFVVRAWWECGGDGRWCSNAQTFWINLICLSFWARDLRFVRMVFALDWHATRCMEVSTCTSGFGIAWLTPGRHISKAMIMHVCLVWSAVWGMCVPRHCCHGCTMVVLVFVRGRMPRLILYEVMYGCVGNGLGCRLPWLCCFMSITLLMLCWMSI